MSRFVYQALSARRARRGQSAGEANLQEALVLYHLVPGGLNGGEPDSNYIDQVTETFSGKVVVAADQMII